MKNTYEITFKGLSGDTNATNLSDLHGIDCQEIFSDYFPPCISISGFEVEEGNLEKLKQSKGLGGGYMEFVYNKAENRLYVEVKYKSNLELNPDELESLKKYTQGQLSDGIGENFEQEPATYSEDGDPIYISPWFRDQKLETSQILINSIKNE